MILSFNDKRLDLSTPAVMGILNITPDSFFDGGRFSTPQDRLHRVETMLAEGAGIIDIGAVSSRPGAAGVTQDEELGRLIPALTEIRRGFPECILSVDTFRPAVARAAVETGADMINDIYGGRYHGDMLGTIASMGVPYILMHMKGTPGTMQQNPRYHDVVAEIAYFFQQQTDALRAMAHTKVLIDPGFGFGKTVAHNFEILRRLGEFSTFGYPIVAGLSRKSMIQKTLDLKPHEALNGSTVLQTIALIKGASILRVHDVKEAVEAVRLVNCVT